MTKNTLRFTSKAIVVAPHRHQWHRFVILSTYALGIGVLLVGLYAAANK